MKNHQMNSNLPSGTVTFLFTDIEGSTKIAQQYPNDMPVLLARHNQILNQAIKAHNGFVFQIVGDSFSAAGMQLVVNLLLGGVSMGVQTVVAHAYGAGERQRAGAAVRSGVWAALLTVPIFVALAFAGRPVFP